MRLKNQHQVKFGSAPMKVLSYTTVLHGQHTILQTLHWFKIELSQSKYLQTEMFGLYLKEVVSYAIPLDHLHCLTRVTLVLAEIAFLMLILHQMVMFGL